MHWIFARPAERQDCQTVSLVGGRVFFDGVVPFLSHVCAIWLRESRVTDEDLRRIGPLAKLDSIELGYTGITDQGAATLRKHPALKYVFLCGTQVTDSCINTLSESAQLRLVNVTGTLVTESGFADLVTKLPNCLVSHKEFGSVFRGNTGRDAYAAWVDS